MKGKLFAIVSLMMVLGLMVTACGPAATPTSAPATEAPQPTAAPTEAMPAPTEAPAPTAVPTEVWSPTIDCTGVTSGDSLTLMYQWSGSEQESINKILQPFVSACGIALTSESTRDAAVLDTRVKSTPPDVLFWPSTAPMTLYGSQLKDLGALGANTSNYPSYWVDGGTMDGKLMSLPAKADIKTIIWYSPAQFETDGYTVPTTFDDLNALVEQMV
jgi:alpha-glucoside transport system substrate-binding protein